MAPHLVEVAFKGKRKEFFLWDGEDPPRVESPVIVEVDRGEDFGRVHAIGERAATRCGGCAHGCGTEAQGSETVECGGATPAQQVAQHHHAGILASDILQRVRNVLADATQALDAAHFGRGQHLARAIAGFGALGHQHQGVQVSVGIARTDGGCYLV